MSKRVVISYNEVNAAAVSIIIDGKIEFAQAMTAQFKNKEEVKNVVIEALKYKATSSKLIAEATSMKEVKKLEEVSFTNLMTYVKAIKDLFVVNSLATIKGDFEWFYNTETGRVHLAFKDANGELKPYKHPIAKDLGNYIKNAIEKGLPTEGYEKFAIHTLSMSSDLREGLFTFLRERFSPDSSKLSQFEICPITGFVITNKVVNPIEVASMDGDLLKQFQHEVDEDGNTLLKDRVLSIKFDPFTGEYVEMTYAPNQAFTGPIYPHDSYPKGTQAPNGKFCYATVYSVGKETVINPEAIDGDFYHSSCGIYSGDSITANGYSRDGSSMMRVILDPRKIKSISGGMLVSTALMPSHIIEGINWDGGVAPFKNAKYYADLISGKRSEELAKFYEDSNKALTEKLEALKEEVLAKTQMLAV